MMASVVRALRRYVEPFYPVDAEEQARLQRFFLGEAPDKADDTTIAEGPVIEMAQATKKKVDLMEKRLEKTNSTVDEMDRHVERCRRDIDGLFVTWSENITNKYTRKFDTKAAEIDSKMETFDQTLEKKCDQAGHKAAAYMDEIVGKHNSKVQNVNEDLKAQLTRLEKKVGEKADASETARFAAENLALRKRLVKFQQEHKSLYEERGKDLVQVMRDHENLSFWVRQVEKDHEAIVLASKADAKNRRVLDRHITAMQRQQSRTYQVPSQAMISVSREQSAPPDPKDGGCRHQEAKMADLVKKLGDYESRLRKLENATTRSSPCQCCHESLEKVNKDLKGAKEALEVESRQKLEEHKTFAKAQYQALEEKLDNLAGLVRELPDLPVYWQMITRLEELEQDKRWNDRIRRLETFGAATPGPVLSHLDYLESRLDTVLYDRNLPLPNAVARGRITWAWETLENALRTESQQDVPAETIQPPGIFHQQLTQQPPQVQLEASSHQIFQEEVLTQPIAQLESISQPICADEVVHEECPKASSPQDETQMPTTTVVDDGEVEQAAPHPSTVQSFGVNLVSNFQAPSVNVPVMDWSTSVSVDLSRDSSEFDDNDPPLTKAPGDRLPYIAEDGDIDTEGPIIAGLSDAGASNDGTATAPPTSPDYEASTQVDNGRERTPQPVLDRHNMTSFEATQNAGIQSPFSVIPPKNNDNDPPTNPGLEQQKHHRSQPLYGGDVSSGYTTVYGTQSVSHAMASASNTGLYTTAISAQPLPIPCSGYDFTSYSSAKPSPTNPNSQPRARYGPPETSQQQPPRIVTSSGFANYTPALPSPSIPGMHLIQPVVDTGIDFTVTPMAPAAEAQHHDTSSDEDSDDERSERQHGIQPRSGNNARARPVLQKPRGRMSKMTDQQKSAIRHEMEQQKSAVGSMQKLPPTIPRPPTPPQPSGAPVHETGVSGTQGKGAESSKAPSASTTIHEREDAVDYGSTDDDGPGPSKPSANIAPTPTVPVKVMHRYSTQWLKIWRSHVVSEQNIRRFAASNGFGDSADKWTAIVENANADTKPQALLGEAKIAVYRQLYSFEDVKKIAEAFFEVCLVQSGSFQAAIEKFDPFHVDSYHKSFVDAFQDYL